MLSSNPPMRKVRPPNHSSKQTNRCDTHLGTPSGRSEALVLLLQLLLGGHGAGELQPHAPKDNAHTTVGQPCEKKKFCQTRIHNRKQLEISFSRLTKQWHQPALCWCDSAPESSVPYPSQCSTRQQTVPRNKLLQASWQHGAQCYEPNVIRKKILECIKHADTSTAQASPTGL